MIFGRVRAHFRRKRIEHHRPTIAQNAKTLDDIYRRRFGGKDKERFEFLWCEIAEVCRVRPDELHEDDQISDRCPGRQSWLSSDTRLDDLEFVIMSESQGVPPPRTKPKTIGEVLDYLLQPNREDDDN
jgi:hypothetical protein